MSEQVTEYLVSRGELLRAEDMKPAEVYRLVDAKDHHALLEKCDALHAEAEALLADSQHWKGMHASSMALRMSAEFERDELRTELDEARGLLNRVTRNVHQMFGHPGLLSEIERFLTTTAPGVEPE